MIFSFNLFVMVKNLSPEYPLYACDKIFRMPRFWTKIFILQQQFPIWGNLSLKDRHIDLSFLLNRLAPIFS